MKNVMTLLVVTVVLGACTQSGHETTEFVQPAAEAAAATPPTAPAPAVVSEATAATAGTSFVYDPATNACHAVAESGDAILDRVRAKAGNECFNLIASDLGFTRILCPHVLVQLILSDKNENCMKGPEEKIPGYTTIKYAQIDELKPATAQQMASYIMNGLRGPLAMYRYHTGTFPKDAEGLKSLLTIPAGKVGWQGPYISDGHSLEDPWKHELVYETFDNGRRYKIISKGPDNTLGTPDDQVFIPYR